jgi:hypothetical protein
LALGEELGRVVVQLLFYEVEGGKEERRLQEIIKAFKDGKSIRHIREVYKVGTGTLYKILEREGLR